MASAGKLRGSPDVAPPAESLDPTRCPRCGGMGMQPKRRRRGNPFLETKNAMPLVCLDCGLDFEVPFDEPESGLPPW